MAIRDPHGYTRKTIEIGDWNMDAAPTPTHPFHGLSATEWPTIRFIQVIVRRDSDVSATNYDLTRGISTADGQQSGYILGINTSQVTLARVTGGFFDSTDFDETSYNRGWVTFEYIAD